jgi:hypothetical protein
MPDLVLRLEQQQVEDAERLLRVWARTPYVGRNDPESSYYDPRAVAELERIDKLLADLRAALDSPPVEERVEFCVIGGDPRSGYNEGGWGPISLPSAQEAARRWSAKGWRNVRIQSRTVTTFSDGSTLTSPWTDLPGEGEPDG